jgi:hypothetical protein
VHYGDHNLHDSAFSFSIATTRAKRLYTCTKVPLPINPFSLKQTPSKGQMGRKHVQTNDGNKVPGDNLFLDPNVSTTGYLESADQWGERCCSI